MPTYVPNATQATEPTESRTVESAAQEFRTLKESVNARIDSLTATVASGDASDIRVPEAAVAPLPVVSERAGKVLGFDVAGDPIMVAVSGTSDPSLRADLASGIGASMVGYTPAGAGAVVTDVQSKLREGYSIRDAGARPENTPAQNYAFIQAALNSGARRVVVPADGDYTINAELVLPAGVVLEGQTGAVIIQDTYGLSGVILRNDGSGVKNLTIKNVKTKTQLSTTVANRYNGEVARSRAAGVYVNAEYCTIKNVFCPGFINGVNLVGGDRVWTTTSGTFTTTTLVLNASSQQADNFYNGWTIRIFSSSNATESVIVTGYDSATNTVTFSAVSTFGGPYYYSLIGPKHRGNRISGYKGDKNDFGILASFQEDFILDDIDQLSIEQTQEVNARPHTVYITNDCDNVRGANWRTQNCPDGHAYKLRGVVDGIFTGGMIAKKSRAVLALESSSKVTVTGGVVGVDIGVAAYRPESANITDCKDVSIDFVSLRIDDGFDYAGDSAFRPASLVIGDGSLPPCEGVRVGKVETNIRGADNAHGVYVTAGTGNHSDIVVGNVTAYASLSTITSIARVFTCDRFRIGSIAVIGAGSQILQLESTSSNATISYRYDDAAPVITNSGTGNKVVVDGVQSGAWTPEVIGTTIAGTNTYSTRVGEFQKIGKVVHLRMRVALSSFNSTGAIRITGLPFPVSQAPGAVGVDVGAVLSTYSGITLTPGQLPLARVISNTSRIDLYIVSDTGNALLLHGLMSSTAALQVGLTYITT